MANRDNPHGFKFHTNLLNGGVVPIWEGLAMSNKAWGSGDVLYASAGYIRGTETADKAPVGIAIGSQLSTTAATRPKVLFYPNIEGVVFSGQEDGTPTQADIWTTDDVVGAAAGGTSTSTQEIDTTGGDAVVVHRIGFHPNTSIGANSEVLFVFNKSSFTGQTSSTVIG